MISDSNQDKVAWDNILLKTESCCTWRLLGFAKIHKNDFNDYH